jgi:hypothetical protein
MRHTTLACRRRLAGGVLGLVLVLAAAGCGAGEGRVSGRVLYNGRPLPGGRVTFRPADPRQNSVSAALDEGGNYTAVLPAGPVQVSVDNRELEPHASLAGLAPANLAPDVRKVLGNPAPGKPSHPGDGSDNHAGNYVKIPDRYYDVESSGLDFTVTGGEQPHDIELRP